MKLIRKLIEDAAGGAVGAGAIAVGPSMPLFAQLTKRDHPKVIKVGKKRVKQEKKKRDGLGLREGFYGRIGEDATQPGKGTFDTTEVISKLKSLENKERADRHNVTTFGLEDDHGNLVRVTIRDDQASSFEAALQAMLSDHDNDERRELPEIAELLFKLKDRFDIVDVDWPEVQEDEEQEVGLAAPEQGGEVPAGGEGDLGTMVGGEEGAAGMGAGGEEEVKSLLTQVIDMMKADAEARKADARAREAEAKAKEADLGRKEAMTKVKQEEQILDMEASEKQKKEEDKEAKRLAKLARWQHEMNDREGIEFEGGEEEEIPAMAQKPLPTTAQSSHKKTGRVAPADVAKFILSRVK